jgi:aldose 1-epimerase
MLVPDKDGKIEDVLLGFDDFAGYCSDANPYFSCTTGRFANRIADGQFDIDGESYQLDCNDAPNHLHGGLDGLNGKMWKGEIFDDQNAVAFSYTSPDGESKYPGTLDITVTYSLNDANELRIDYRATTDKATVINLTNHAYFNLDGNGNGLCKDHKLMVNADHYLSTDENGLPLGELTPVDGSGFDLRESTRIGDAFEKLDCAGFDHNFCINQDSEGAMTLAGVLVSDASGRKLTVETTEPGVQVYTGRFLEVAAGKGGKAYPQFGSVCLETQHYPDSPNNDHFPSTELRPGDVFESATVHRFEVG